MPNLRQPPTSAHSQDGLEAQKPIIPPFHGQAPLQSVTQPGILAKLPDVQVAGLAQSTLIPVQPQLQHLPPAQAQHLSQAVLIGKPGVPAFSQPLGGLSVPPLTSAMTSKGLLQQIQAPSLQQDRPMAPAAGGVHSTVSIQQPLSGRLPSAQVGQLSLPFCSFLQRHLERIWPSCGLRIRSPTLVIAYAFSMVGIITLPFFPKMINLILFKTREFHRHIFLESMGPMPHLATTQHGVPRHAWLKTEIILQSAWDWRK